MSLPVLLVLDGDLAALGEVEAQLVQRYGHDYRVASASAPDAALRELTGLADAGAEVALVLTTGSLAGVTGGDLLERARQLHPHAKCGLMVAWDALADPPTAEAIVDAIALGRIDYYVPMPAAWPDEVFHHTISTFLLEWATEQRKVPHTVHIIGEEWSGRAHELRETFQSCAAPHTFCLASSPEGRKLLAKTSPDVKLPVMILPDGTALSDPSNAEIARAAGAPTDFDGRDFDVVIVGAGPAGLSAAVYGASEGLRTLVVGASFVFMHRATTLSRSNGQLTLTLADGRGVNAAAVILATGASYRRLEIPSLEALNGAGVFYGGPASVAHALSGTDVFVAGGGNSAGQAVLHLARYARRATLVVRGTALESAMSHYLIQEIQATPNVDVRTATTIVGGGGDIRLRELVLRDGATGNEETVAADALFALIGAHPHTDWLPADIARDRHGFLCTGEDLPDGHHWPLDERRPFALETSMPGVLAAGDVRHGSVKRVASAVGEGSIAVQLIHALLAAEPARA